ncbi:MAG: serine/threonine-protein kinase, partial [Isosphaeraceae bacterium]
MVRLLTSTNPGGCLRRETLVLFDRCELPDEEQEAVARHVANCPLCEAVLMEILEAGDPFLNRLRRCVDAPEPDVGPAFHRLKCMTETADVPPDAGTPSRFDLTWSGKDEFEFRTLGGYELYEQIGKGGMGAVYRARHVALNAPRALKLILPGRAARDPHTMERFQREARNLARVDHPNVVKIHDFGEIEGLPFYAMELLEGPNLWRKLRPEGGRQSPDEAARTVRTLALAMHDVHAKEVIHRDLKTSNVVVGPDGKLTIVDFGLAKRIAADPGVFETLALTEDQQVLGTPPYISPEQAGAFGKVEVTRATDVYSLGAILYELLTGRPPFQGETVQQTLQMVCHQDPEPPSSVGVKVDRGLESICLKCLEKRPAR